MHHNPDDIWLSGWRYGQDLEAHKVWEDLMRRAAEARDWGIAMQLQNAAIDVWRRYQQRLDQRSSYGD